MDVRVRTFGSFEIEGITSKQLGSRKAGRLVQLLALERSRPVAVDYLIECLWPDEESAPDRPEQQLGVLASRLRAVLGADHLVRIGASYKLVCDWLDLDVVEQLAVEATGRLQVETTPSPALRVTRASRSSAGRSCPANQMRPGMPVRVLTRRA
jgi:DNA-binding SARP family transcriptional activator